MKKLVSMLVLLCFVFLLNVVPAAAESEVNYVVTGLSYNNAGALEVKGSLVNNTDKPKSAKSLNLVINAQSTPTGGFQELIRTTITGPELTQKYIKPGAPVETNFVFPKAKKIPKILEFTFSATVVPDVPISVVLNNTPIEMSNLPVIVKGRTLVPLRDIFQALGTPVEWDNQTRTVSAKKDGVEMQLVVGKAEALINGKVVKLDVPAQIVNGRTYVPVRFVGETFGAQVNWDNANKVITISK